MYYNPEIHHRWSIRLKDYNYSSPGAYFITICTYHRQSLFGTIIKNKIILNEYGTVVMNIWNDIPNHYANVECNVCVIMPNHFHGIVEIKPDIVGAIHELPLHESPLQQKTIRRKMTIPKIVGRLKMTSSKQINILRKNPKTPVWQRNYYEHIIRNEEEYSRIAEYIINNPANWNKDIYYP